MQQEIRPVFHFQGVHSASQENKCVNGQFRPSTAGIWKGFRYGEMWEGKCEKGNSDRGKKCWAKAWWCDCFWMVSNEVFSGRWGPEWVVGEQEATTGRRQVWKGIWGQIMEDLNCPAKKVSFIIQVGRRNYSMRINSNVNELSDQ